MSAYCGINMPGFKGESGMNEIMHQPRSLNPFEVFVVFCLGSAFLISFGIVIWRKYTNPLRSEETYKESKSAAL
jgi:hypothetical protein